MAQKPNSIKHKQKKPSKLTMAVALGIAFFLPYYLVKNFSHHQPEKEIHTLSLPKPERHLPQTIKTAALPTSKIEATPAPVKKVVVPVIKDNVWQTVMPRSGDSMAAIFNRLGLSAQNLHAILQKKSPC